MAAVFPNVYSLSFILYGSGVLMGFVYMVLLWPWCFHVYVK